jgi:hypothetical protein
MEQDLSSLLLGKPLGELTLPDLQHYFQQAKTESNKLEFKSFTIGFPADSDKEERNILRTICGFLNSEGGILIWGSPTGIAQPGQKEKVFQGQLTTTPICYEKDAYISKIANRIIPSPRGILFHRIEDQRKYVYLFEVPVSEYSPHQFSNTYLMRMDGQTKAAPHSYIEALFRKITFPRLGGYLRIDGLQTENADLSALYCTLIFRNQSRYQNDENLHCRLVSDQGRVTKLDSVITPLDGAIASGSSYGPVSIADIIYFGEFLHHSFRIILSWKRLAQTSHQVRLRVQFGARYSPMKLCFYTLKIALPFPANKRSVIADKVENIFFHENNDAEGITDDERLEDALDT